MALNAIFEKIIVGHIIIMNLKNLLSNNNNNNNSNNNNNNNSNNNNNNNNKRSKKTKTSTKGGVLRKMLRVLEAQQTNHRRHLKATAELLKNVKKALRSSSS